MSAEPKTSLSFTDDDLKMLAVSIATEQENVVTVWDDSRAAGVEDNDYWRLKHEHLVRLHRRVLSARRRLDVKARR